jgi:hypothetical protein
MRGALRRQFHARSIMQEIDTQDYARQLLELRGDKAVAVAAEKARSFEKNGNSKEAKTWRHIEAALKLMRGPHQS